MLFTLTDERRDGPNDAIIKTISSRRAGGRRELNTEPSRVRSKIEISIFEGRSNVNFSFSRSLST